MHANIIVYDVGSTYTKAAAFALQDETLRYLGRGQAPPTHHDIAVGTRGAEAELSSKGIILTDDVKRYSSCSAAGGLRMVALGFMPRVTVKAAKEVAMTAGARVMQVVSADEPLSFRKEVLREINPDIILLSGGTDGGDETCVLENADMICELKGKATVIVACNKYVQLSVADKFAAAGISFERVPNILSTIHELNVAPAREAIHEQFIRQIARAKGLLEFRDTLADKVVVPTPGAVLLASELLAKGSFEQDGTGSLILIDIGGATTDIHSALPELENLTIEERGLVINNEKQFSYRTVEGNLGLRVSATGIPDAVGPKAVIRAMDGDYGVSPEEVLHYAETLEHQTDHVPADEREAALDRALAMCAIQVALRRHAGIYAQEADPVMGIMAGTAMGRDLRHVNRVICVGGIFVHLDRSKSVDLVRRCFAEPGISLLPLEEPEILIDKDYIFYSMGVLGKHYPDEVLHYMKEHFK
jgi:uncharacterized protein (TIGR01319 family)